MGITFAANGVYVGMAAGLLAGIATDSAVVGIAVAIAASVAAWYLIRGLEAVLGRGVSAGFTAMQNRANRASGQPMPFPAPTADPRSPAPPYQSPPTTGALPNSQAQ